MVGPYQHMYPLTHLLGVNYFTPIRYLAGLIELVNQSQWLLRLYSVVMWLRKPLRLGHSTCSKARARNFNCQQFLPSTQRVNGSSTWYNNKNNNNNNNMYLVRWSLAVVLCAASPSTPPGWGRSSGSPRWRAGWRWRGGGPPPDTLSGSQPSIGRPPS